MSDTTIDDLLNELTGNPDTAPVDQVAQAKSALYELMLGVIGEDEEMYKLDTPTVIDPNDFHQYNIRVFANDYLRAEQRTKLKGLFK